MQEAANLRHHLQVLASDPEVDLLVRYDLMCNLPPPGWRWQLQRQVWRALRALGLERLYPQPNYVWLASLQHGQKIANGMPVLIWALGKDRNTVRRACEGFLQRLADQPAWVPVLVTDVADFAYFSRLGWLVEYLPELSGSGQSYRNRKQRHLAWRYRDALAVPLSAGLANQTEWDEFIGQMAPKK